VVSTALATVKVPVTASAMGKRFARARAAVVGEILEMLCAMGESAARQGGRNVSALMLQL
jgi:hypothetical protein